MSGVDLHDQLNQYYACSRKSVKWWKKAFFWILESCITNARILRRLHARDDGRKWLCWNFGKSSLNTWFHQTIKNFQRGEADHRKAHHHSGWTVDFIPWDKERNRRATVVFVVIVRADYGENLSTILLDLQRQTGSTFRRMLHEVPHDAEFSFNIWSFIRILFSLKCWVCVANKLT